MQHTATFSFSVTAWKPTSYDRPESGPELSEVHVSKAFTGDLEATSDGRGLFCGLSDPSQGAGYLVCERVAGRLRGLDGTFVLQHSGLMAPGESPVASGHVVPGSGTGSLTGISGTMALGPDHTMTLTYQLPDPS